MSWIVHADASLVVVDKPAGLLAVPGRGADKQDCAWSRVQATWPDARVVHRLDMATSGLLVFALGLQAQQFLNRAFATRAVYKRYVAVVDGVPDSDSGCIDLPLSADWPNRPRQQVDREHGRPALTHWRVLERGRDGRTRLSLEPITGRSHQLRVHAAAMGWPIVGDALYGRPAGPEDRLLLHATALVLPHPLHGDTANWTSEAPF